MAEEVTVFMIENKKVADSFRNQFEKIWEQEVTTTKGVNEIQNAWNKMLDELELGEEYYVMGASDRNQEGLYDYLVDFHKRRQSKGVKSKFLFVSNAKKFVERFKDNYYKLSDVRYLPQEVYKGIQFNLYKNKVLIIVWREKEPIVFTIEDKTTYDTFKSYFDSLWDQRTQTYQGDEGFKSCFERIYNELNKGDTLYVLGAPKEANEKFDNFLLNWHKKREQKGVGLKILYNHDARKFGKKRSKLKLSEVKYMKEELETPAWIVIFNDFVVTMNVSGEPICFLIEDKNSANSYKKYFDALWKTGKK